MLNERIKPWIGFNLVKGIGPARLKTLIEHFGSVGGAWEANANDLQQARLGTKLTETMLEVRSSDALDRTWDYLQQNKIDVLTWQEAGYPRYLMQIDLPPPVLYVRGELLDEDDWAVAVVGTRRMTKYGRQAAQDVAGMLARNGITVVSGLARGIDSVAHRQSLESNGRTLGILGCGIDRVYPPENRDLAKQIASKGAVITDYAPGTKPEASNFPARNRIISGLARAVVVVEAGSRSGALITSSFAAEQGREVLAVPGSIFAPSSKGTNRLIQQGAHPLLDPQDILELLNLEMIHEHRSARTVLPEDATEAQLYHILGDEALHVDEIHAQSDLPIEKVTATLTLMELKGIIRQVGAMHYAAVHETVGDYNTEESKRDE
jgi:DNA processing protein